jgi:signal transduction histidine kinase
MEFIGITATGWGAILVTLSMAFLSLMMALIGKERLHHVWAFFCTIVTVWIGAFYLAVISSEPASAEFWWKISYVGIILIPFSFLHFVFEFINFFTSKVAKETAIFVLYLAAAILIFLNLETSLIVNGVEFLFNQFYYGRPGLVHPYFLILYISLVSYSFYLVYKQYKKSNEKFFKQRILYFFLATFVAFAGGSLNFLPIYGIKIPPISNASVVVGVAILSYAILRYRLFDTKVVMAQLLTLVIISFSVIRLFVFSSVQWLVFDLLLLIVSVFVGLNLIRSVRKEVEQREQLQILTKQLESANKQLKILDQARAEFITIASHQLRTPPATIKWYLAAILDGDYGKFDDSVKDQLRKTMSTNNSMIALIDDLLNVSRIERGKMEFIFQPTDLTEITQITIDQLLPQAEMRKLNLVFKKPKEVLPIITADKEKLRQVINNLIDNAIKYSQNGKIVVEVGKVKNDLMFKVTDNGKGVTAEQKPHIFEKFDRGKNPARNSSGLGLGLYVAKVIIEQHNGKIWVESKGEGKGSAFIFTVPIKAKLDQNAVFDLTKTQKVA